MTQVALGNPENYTIGGIRFYFNKDVTGQTPIVITAVDEVGMTFTVAGDESFELGYGAKFTVTGSTGGDNDGDYISLGAVYDSVGVETTVTVAGPLVAEAAPTGSITITRLGELYLGNVVTGNFNSDITYLDHFTAKTGSRKKDRSIPQEIAIQLNLTLDEPNVDAMNYFMLGGTVADNTYETLNVRTFKPYTEVVKDGGCRMAGVSDTGNEWIWEVPNCTFKPDGEFTFNDQDWSQFSFIVELLDDSANDATTPYGDLYHFGVDQDIDVTIPLPDNS
jgi:hypothetical protein